MVYLYICSACERGDHTHCEKGQPAPPGVFGGSKCKCLHEAHNTMTTPETAETAAAIETLRDVAHNAASPCISRDEAQRIDAHITALESALASSQHRVEELTKRINEDPALVFWERLHASLDEAELGLRSALAREKEGK